MTNLVINVPSEYISLGLVMQSALEQASKGKGRERHASEGEAYEDQIICEVARRVGLGYPLGQAVKKIYESQRLIPQLGVQELLGAMNYLAAAVIVMQERMEEEGRRFREGFSHAEGDRCQSGNDQPELKPGDSLLVTMPEGEDVPCVYVGESMHPGCCCVRYLSGGNSGDTDDTVPLEALRRPPETESGCFQNGNGHSLEASAEPEFKSGDKVEVQMAPDSSTWASAVITAVYRDKDTCEWRYCVDFEDGWAHLVVPSARVRHVSTLKAEGCEALVEKDAPQTREELFQHIVDCNPATFHTPSYAEEQLEHHSRLQAHKPTGEELAEEEKRG